MNVWWLASVIMLCGGLAPACLLGCRESAADRLVGLSLAGGITVFIMLTLTQVYGQSAYLIVPLVLAVLSVAGVLVYTRLLGPR